MLNKDNFEEYIGFQDCTDGAPYGHLLVFKHRSWVEDIRTLTHEEIMDHLLDDAKQVISMSLSMEKQHVNCTMTLEQALIGAGNWLTTFPKTDKNILYANNRIAFNTRRGAGNRKINNITLYKGATKYDCCLAIIKYGERYGIYKHPKFSSYGFVLTNEGNK